MATTLMNSRAHLDEMNDDLLRQIEDLQAKCQWLSSYRQELLDCCLGHQLNLSSCFAALETNIEPAWSHNTPPFLSTESFWTSRTSMPTWTSDAFHSGIAISGFTPNTDSWPYIFPVGHVDSQDLDCHQAVFAGYNALDQQHAGFGRQDKAVQDNGIALANTVDLPQAESYGSQNIILTTASDYSHSFEPANDLWMGTQPGQGSSCASRLEGDAIHRLNFTKDAIIDDDFAATLINHTNLASQKSINYDCGLTLGSSFDVADTTALESITDDEMLSLKPGNHAQNQARKLSSSASNTFPLLQQVRTAPDLRVSFGTSAPKGRLDQYIVVLSEVLKRFDTHMQLTPKLRKKVSLEGVLWVVREAWPQAEHFWKATASFQGFLQFELWRNFPGMAVYKSMHPAYRPTPTQLYTPHSSIIDWLPWPDLRDKVIQYQDQIDVDLVCKLAIQNVVAHRRTLQRRKRLRGHSMATEKGSTYPEKTSFRVWELCLLEERAGYRPPEGTDLVYRPQSVPVQTLGKAYGLEYDDFLTQKLHPRFFDAFPNLFVESAVSHYVVQNLPAVQRHPQTDLLGSPHEISHESVERLEKAVCRLLHDSS